MLLGHLLQVDTMIVQAIGLLDDLDKELNTYAMRVREWYGWHFPEMTKVRIERIIALFQVGQRLRMALWLPLSMPGTIHSALSCALAPPR